MNNTPYKDKLEKRSKSAFVWMAAIFAAALLLMTVFALFYQIRQKREAALEQSRQKLYQEIMGKGWPRESIIDLNAPDSAHTPSQIYTVKEAEDSSRLHRYFLVSYSSMEKGSSEPIIGQSWFSTTGGFFGKAEFDSIIYSGFLKKRKCYQHIIITSIYEFKSLEDYNSFSDNYKGDPYPKRHKECCEPDSTRLPFARVTYLPWKVIEGKRRDSI